MMVELKIPHYLGAVDRRLDLFYYRLSLILYKGDLVFKIALDKNMEVVVRFIVSLSEDQLNYFRVNHCKICCFLVDGEIKSEYVVYAVFKIIFSLFVGNRNQESLQAFNLDDTNCASLLL
jgi:hypothetical protein